MIFKVTWISMLKKIAEKSKFKITIALRKVTWYNWKSPKWLRSSSAPWKMTSIKIGDIVILVYHTIDIIHPFPRNPLLKTNDSTRNSRAEVLWSETTMTRKGGQFLYEISIWQLFRFCRSDQFNSLFTWHQRVFFWKETEL